MVGLWPQGAGILAGLEQGGGIRPGPSSRGAQAQRAQAHTTLSGTFQAPWKELSAEKKRTQLSSVVTKLSRFKVGHLILALLIIKIDLSISGPYLIWLSSKSLMKSHAIIFLLGLGLCQI